MAAFSAPDGMEAANNSADLALFPVRNPHNCLQLEEIP
jgi:hypothetical protein